MLKIITELKLVLLIALLHLFLTSVLYAQTLSAVNSFTTSLKGKVVDSATHIALSHVTVLVQEPGKDQPFKNTLTNENGSFEITGLFNNQYHLIITFSGYKAKTIQLPAFTSSSINLGIIALDSLIKLLKEVQVVTQRPIIEQDLDKITYNIEADPESKTASAFEILRKVPLLSLDADDNIQVNGNSNYRVLINGKPSTLFLRNQSDIFKNIPANALKTIEVITVPSSRYEAQGVGGIINITTHKKTLQGYNGGINIRVSNPKSIYTNGNLTFNTGKLSFAGNYGYNNNTSPSNKSTLYRKDKLRNTTLGQAGMSNNNSYFQNAGGELIYELNNFNVVTASYNLNKNKSSNDFTQQVGLLNDAGWLTEAYNNFNSGTGKSRGNDFGLDYQRSFKKNDAQQLTLSYKWINSTNNSSTNFILEPVVNYKGQISTTDNNDGLKEHNIQADYVQPIKRHTLELGVHAIFRQNNSDYFYKDKDTVTDHFILDTSQSNNFHYKENLYSSYASFQLRMGKWGMKFGGRLEQTKIDAQFISSGTIAKQEYLTLIPNFTLSRQLKGISMLKLSYTQRIQRPDLYYLDPYVDRTDPLNISYGNPGLQPALGHVFDLAYNTFIKKVSLHINVFHQFTNNSIQQFTTLGADTVALTTFENIGKNRNSSLSINTITTFLKNLGINMNSSLHFVQYTRNIIGKPHKNEGLTYSISGSVSYRYKGWRTSSNLSYYAPNVLVQGKTASYISNSISVNKYFLKNNKANIGLSVTSPFGEHRRSYTEIEDPAFYQMRESLSVIRRFNLSFNYRFTKVQASNTK